MKIKQKIICIISVLILTSCATPPPANPENICDIFTENRDWYHASKNMNKKWGTPIHVPIAMMYQESSFKHNAAPPMQYFWFIPIGRASDAYGYAQARNMTWDDYQRETGNSWADRDDFDDAIDFMGWYTYKTQKINGVSKWDAYGQYLNYHEGWGGYKRASYRKKPWLMRVSKKVDNRARQYALQLKTCRENLDSSWLWRLFFT
ncbi:MAG TPA: hypothetical protein VIC51_07885 [Psychromonas sp.]